MDLKTILISIFNLKEPEKTTEELQEELQNDLKQRALTAMNKKRFEKLKAKAQGTFGWNIPME